MKYLCTAILLVLLASCGKRIYPVPPTVGISYTSDRGSHDEFHVANDSFFDSHVMVLYAGADTVSVTGDSVAMIFSSEIRTLTSQGDIAIYITHVFPKNKLTYSGGQWTLNNLNDLYDALRSGVTPASRITGRSNNMYINFRPAAVSSPTYSLLDEPADATITVTPQGIDAVYDWFPAQRTVFQGYSSRPTLVTIDFSGRMLSPGTHDTMTVQHLRYQGAFIDRR